ncbi:unnamed protein product [Ostreobium quekettii]|uniref:Ion transport domain-containing protein n=1 Tax=Ostreobium quekettii TaxID=121088 RepID=A0A8S1JFI4_9CHLO|nr:unnamed protein product [Ostreobium quekettii]|eukprot:evm.model.scf_1840.1 EVM.evm.TU.scf_1840.1   scf_1840:7008-12756(-)
MDGTRLLTGHKCGDVCVWDAEHGKLIASLSGVHKFQILACHFIGMSKNSVASLDQSCSLVTWNLITGTTTVAEIARGVKMEALDPERCEIAFSHDGSLLALTLNTPVDFCILRKAAKLDKSKKDVSRKSRKTMTQGDKGLRAAFLDLYRLDGNTDGGTPKREARLTVAWRPETPYSLNGVQFADNGNGLLVGMYSSDELMPGYVVVWPDWHSPDVSLSLSGSLGSWSKDGNLVVTWDPFIRGTGHKSEKASGACFVWDIVGLRNRAMSVGSGDAFGARGIYLTPSALTYEEMIKEDVPVKKREETSSSEGLRENFHGHPELSPRFIADEAVFESLSDVLWARFVWAPKGEHRLATCAVEMDIRMQIWKVEKKTLHLTLTTGIERSERLDDWARDFITGNETESVAVSPDQCWLGLYVEKENKGFIWNAVEGVRLLNISLPDGDLIKNYNLSFGGHGCRMAMIAKVNFLLWDTGALSGADRGTGRQMCHYTLPMEAHDGSLVKTLSGKDRRGGGDNHPIVDLKFSFLGNKLGIFRRASSVLHVQDFETQVLLHLKEDKKNSSNFQAFTFSRDGSRLVGVLGDGSVHLWNTAAVLGVSPEEGLHFQYPVAQLGRLDGYFHGASGVVFSSDETGKEMVVVCDDGGTLVWLDTELCVEVHRLKALNSAEGDLLAACLFKADGSSVALHTDRDAAIVIDIVKRKMIGRSEFTHHVQEARSFPDNIAGDSSLAVAGWDDITNKPIVCRPGEHLDLSMSDSVYMNVAISEDGAWLVKDDISNAPSTAKDKGALCMHIVSRSNGRVLVMPIIAGAHTKELRTDRIPTPEVLAISHNGRRIACAGSDQVVVWTPYATKGCVPDYCTLDASGILNNKRAFEAIVMEHGPAVMNRADAQGVPFIMSAIDHEKATALKVVLKYCQSTRTRLLFFTHSQNPMMNPRQGRCKNAVGLAIERRLPDTVVRLIRAMYDGVVSRNVMASIFKETLVPLGRRYPSLFLEAISGGHGGHGMPVTIGKINVPERLLGDHGFVAETFPKFLDLDVQKLWSRTLPVSRRRSDEVMVPALAQAYPYPGCCKVGMNGLLRHLLVSKGIPDQAFSTSLVQSIITFKWQAYAHKMVVKEAITYCIFVILFTAYAIVLGKDHDGSSLFGGSDNSDEDNDDVTELILLAICALCALFNLKEEFHQLRTYVREGREHGFNGLGCWALSKWNALEIGSSIMVAFVLPAMQLTANTEERQQWQSVLVAMTAITVWWKLLYFATPFKATGPLVIVIFEVIKDIFFFVFLLVAIMFGFSVAFFLAFRHDVGDVEMAAEELDAETLKELQEVSDAFGHYQNALFTTFGMMLGDFELGLFYGKALRIFPRLLFVLYMAIMMIMMLNLLISLMGFSFDRVKQSEETTFLKARALVIDDMESMANSDTKRLIESKISEFLHIIVPRHSSHTAKQEQQEQQELQEKLEKQLEQAVREYGSTLRNELMGELGMLAARQKSSFVGLKEAVEERLEDTSNALIGEMRRMLSPRGG